MGQIAAIMLAVGRLTAYRTHPLSSLLFAFHSRQRDVSLENAKLMLLRYYVGIIRARKKKIIIIKEKEESDILLSKKPSLSLPLKKYANTNSSNLEIRVRLICEISINIFGI